jgi:hypothetical protein
MKKQITYPDLISRVFCTTFDIMIAALLVSLIDHYLRTPICLWSLQNIIKENALDPSNLKQLEEFFSAFKPTSSQDSQAILLCKLLPPLLEMILLIAYTLFFWLKYAKTPAKFILQMKVVDQNTLEKPSTKQFIIRVFAILLYPIGVWWAIFTKKKQTLHDLISGTCVIKS